MKTAKPAQLNGYLEKLTGMLATEKKYLSCLKKLSAKAFTDELRMGLSPDSSDQQMHIQRLGLCIGQHKIKKAGQLSDTDRALLETATQIARGKERTLEKDLILLKTGQQIFRRKSETYVKLQKIADSLGFGQSALLLEQCYRDDQNAFNYLLQVSQNIIAPKVA